MNNLDPGLFEQIEFERPVTARNTRAIDSDFGLGGLYRVFSSREAHA